MLTRSLFSLISIFAISLVLGCSGNQPISPDLHQIDLTSNSCPTLSISERTPDGSPLGGTGILGIFQASINPVSLEGKLEPVRKTGSQDVLESVDITNFLSLVPCINCIQIKSISMDSDGRLVLDIGIKHPFAKADPSKPITGRNRADLHVFNIEGTVFFKDDTTSVISFPGIGASISPATLENADGYSPYLDTPIDAIFPTVANIHPYKLHFDDFSEGNYSPSSENGFTNVLEPSGNLVMKMGSDFDYRDYVFNLGDETAQFEFLYAVGCTYGISSDNRSQRLTPVYRLPQFNKKAASKAYIDEIIEDGTTGFRPGATGTSETIIFKVLDMNYGYQVGSALDQLMHSSDIQEIDIELPQIFNGIKSFTNPIPTGGDGRDPSNPLSFTFKIFNELGVGEGKYNGLIKVLDSYPPLINTGIAGDGIGRVEPIQIPIEGLFSIAEFATYTAFTVEVKESNFTPVACFSIMPGGQPPIELPVKFNGGCSNDSDGSVIRYEWDFDYHAPTFDNEAEGAVVYHPYYSLGSYTIALRVTDNGTPQMSNTIAHDVTIAPSPGLAFGANTLLMHRVAPDPTVSPYQSGDPVGEHYSDATGNKVYCVFPAPSATQNLFCIRSDNAGATFVTPAVQVSQNSWGLFDSASVCLTDTGKADVVWTEVGLPGWVFHDRASSFGYSFGTDNLVTDLAMLGFFISHGVFGENRIFTTYTSLNLSTSPIYGRVFIQTSANSGATWSSPKDVSQESGSSNVGYYTPGIIAVDDNGVIHVIYLTGQDTPTPGHIRYTKSTNYGSSFSTFVPLWTITGYTNDYKSISLDTSTDGQKIYLACRSQSAGINNIYITVSQNGGSSFGPQVAADDRPNNCDYPCLVADDYGWIYLSYEDRLTTTNYDVRVQRSKTNGSTWEPSIKINDDLTNSQQVVPSIAVDEQLRIHCFWRDDRDAADTYFDLYYARGI